MEWVNQSITDFYKSLNLSFEKEIDENLIIDFEEGFSIFFEKTDTTLAVILKKSVFEYEIHHVIKSALEESNLKNNNFLIRACVDKEANIILIGEITFELVSLPAIEELISILMEIENKI